MPTTFQCQSDACLEAERRAAKRGEEFTQGEEGHRPGLCAECSHEVDDDEHEAAWAALARP
jgi:hypothetical protein